MNGEWKAILRKMEKSTWKEMDYKEDTIQDHKQSDFTSSVY